MDIRHEGQVRLIKRRVFYTGTDALEQGIGLCYDRDYGTDTDAETLRDWRVNRPTTADNGAFAGVTIQSHAAKAGGQWIEIAEPGSICYISVAIATVVNATRLTSMVGAGGRGVFGYQGLPGRGTALALQTKAAATAVTQVDVVVGSLIDGTADLDAAGTTLTDSGAASTFTYSVADDEVLVVCSATAAGVAAGTPGRYVVDSVTTTEIVVLTAAAAAAACSCVMFTRRGNPMVLALLEDGEESGLHEYIEMLNGAASEPMPGGKTSMMGGQDIAGNCTAGLVDGLYVGMRKRYLMTGTLATSNFVVTLATTGEQIDGTTNLATLTFDTAAMYTLVEWMGSYWQVVANAGTVQG